MDYTKSFCNCYRCTQKKYKLDSSGTPTNMSVYNFEFPEYFQCHDKTVFKSDIEPKFKKGYEYLNPQVYTDNYAKNFSSVETTSNNFLQPKPNGYLALAPNKKQVFTNDPRLYSGSHATWMALDTAPTDSSMKLYDIPKDKKLDNYGQYYKTYSDINAGQIMYYINKEQEDPFTSPLFSSSGNTEGILYKDPMGAIKPQYSFKNIKNDNPLTTSERNNYEGKLSWIEDTTNHRQDLMALQQRKNNEQNWEFRYAKN